MSLTEEERARLEYLRGIQHGSADGIVRGLIEFVDRLTARLAEEHAHVIRCQEEAFRCTRLFERERGAHTDTKARLAGAEYLLAEEQAKLLDANLKCNEHVHVDMLRAEKERAEAAERELATAKSVLTLLEQILDHANVPDVPETMGDQTPARVAVLVEQLAEERASREASKQAFQAERAMLIENGLALVARTEAAEARVKELEAILHHYAFYPEVPGGTPLEKVPECLANRVRELEEQREEWCSREEQVLANANAELQALVDAATVFELGPYRVSKRRSHWEVSSTSFAVAMQDDGDPREAATLDEAIALARSLAEKDIPK